MTSSVAEDGSAVVTVEGELDFLTSPTLMAELDRLIGSGVGRVTVDLAGLTFMDSSGIGVFVHTFRRLGQTPGSLDMRNPQPSVRNAAEITGITRLIPCTV